MNLGEYHKFMVKHVFKPFQKEIVSSVLDHTKIAILGARQIGKSYALAYSAVMLACGFDKTPGSDVKVISETEDKAKKIIDDIHKHIDKIEAVCGQIREKNRGGIFEVVLINGAKITALAGKPTSLQAFSGHVIVDELSLTRFDPEQLFAQALIVGSSKDYLRTIICTNADVEGSFVDNFWNSQDVYWKNRRKGWEMFDFNIFDVYDELPERIEEIKTSISPAQWQRFFLNTFTSGNDGFFNPVLVDSCISRQIEHDPVIVLAYDPGFARHGSAMIVCEVSDHIKVIHEDLLFKMDVEDQLNHLDDLVKRFQITSIVIDQGVGGLVIAQRLERSYGAMVSKLSVNKNAYGKWSAVLERLLYEGKLSVAISCKNTIDDLRSFEKDKRGLLTVPERKVSGGISHCDCGVALLMATTMLETSYKSNVSMEIFDIAHSFGKYI